MALDETSHSDQSTQQFQSAPPVSDKFNALTLPAQRLADMRAAFDALENELSVDNVHLPVGELMATYNNLAAIGKDIEKQQRALQKKILPHYLALVERETMALSDPEAPEIGHQFIERMKEANCRTTIRPDIDFPAVYVSYVYGGRNQGFLNEIGLNPSKISEDINAFASSLRHEDFHALQKHNAEALHLSPFNPDTNAIVHPLHWILLEELCEKDAYTKQAFFNALDAVKDPSVRDASEKDIVSVRKFEEHRASAWSLENALVNTALNALSGRYVGQDYVGSWRDHYHGVALDNYARAIKSRYLNGEKDITFVRLDAKDFHAVGNYNVGPNSLGEKFIDPQFIETPELNRKHQRLLDDLCENFGIPTLESCVTLSGLKIKKEPALVKSPAPTF